MTHDNALDLSVLFQPVCIGGASLSNRLVMSPMTRALSPDGIPTVEMATYYKRRIEGGLGLVITEAVSIDHPSATGNSTYARFHGPALDGWKRVVEEVHASGGKIFPQLWHTGPMRQPGTGPRPESPVISASGFVAPGRRNGREMTQRDIRDVIDAFVTAAEAACELGFDGVEIHGAHGFVIDSFFWAGTNSRIDKYGGTMRDRTRFACEIVEAVRESVCEHMPVSFRLSQWKESDYEARVAHSPQELADWVEPLCDAGVDIFHCSTRRFWQPEFHGSDLNLAGWVKKISGRPTITVGSVGLSDDIWSSFGGRDACSTGEKGLGELVRRLGNTEFDLVAVGRAVLADPQWPRKIRERRFNELKPFTKEHLAYLY